MGRCQQKDEYSPSVAIGHATDALVLAVDALCLAKGMSEPRRHGDTPKVFLGLIRNGLIPETAAQWRDLITRAMHQRTAFQNQGELTSRSEARRFVQEIEGLVAFVRSEIEKTSA